MANTTTEVPTSGANTPANEQANAPAVDNSKPNQRAMVLPFDTAASMYRAMVTKSITSGLSAYHEFLVELGEKESVDTIINEALKKGLSTLIRYQATVVRNKIGDQTQTLSKVGAGPDAIARFVAQHAKIHDSLIGLAEGVQKGIL